MKKKYYDTDEKALAESFERGEWRSVRNVDSQRRKLRDAARSTLQKDARIHIHPRRGEPD
jgi:hypothetical protein